jgi:hypothetical protein
VNYIYGGWLAGGTGLMDEDGRSGHTYVGSNAYCLEGADPNYPTYFACDGTHFPAPNANAALGADLDVWEGIYFAKYMKNFRDYWTAHNITVPFFGLDSLGNWGSPPAKWVLQAAAAYCDVIEMDGIAYMVPEYPQREWTTAMSAELPGVLSFTTRYAGDIPLGDFNTITANNDSDEFPRKNFSGNIYDLPTQAQRGNMIYQTVNYLLTHNGYNGDVPWVEFNQWTSTDFQQYNAGIISLYDNAYDGVEGVSATVNCESGFTVNAGATCGGEPATYGNAITETNGMAAANALWLQ